MNRFFGRMVVASSLLVTLWCISDSSISYAQKKQDSGKSEKGINIFDVWPKVKGTLAKIEKVDTTKKTAVVRLQSGKTMNLTIKKEVVFYGPRGGKRTEGIKDQCFANGYNCKLVFDKSGKELAEIHLAIRVKPRKD